MKNILFITIWIISALGIMILFGFARERYQASSIQDMHIRIDRHETNGFLEYNAIKTAINNSVDTLIGKQIKQLNIENIHTLISKNPWVSSSHICVGLDGVLRVNVSERNAVVRVFNQKNKSIYIDSKGFIFPENHNFTPRVRIVSGYVKLPMLQKENLAHISDSIFGRTILSEILHLELSIRNNSLLDALIDQIYITSLGEYELVPKIGNAIVLLGNLELLDQKLNQMENYFRKSAAMPEMLHYRTINLKYRNQIVCTKI